MVDARPSGTAPRDAIPEPHHGFFETELTMLAVARSLEMLLCVNMPRLVFKSLTQILPEYESEMRHWLA